MRYRQKVAIRDNEARVREKRIRGLISRESPYLGHEKNHSKHRKHREFMKHKNTFTQHPN